MDRFHEMSVFLAVAEAQGFAAAARLLQLSPPSVTRAVAGLEERIGARLLVRTTRHVRLTEAGQRYLEDCRRILGEIEAAEDSAAGTHAAPRGLLTLTSPVLFGQIFVMPILLDYLDQHAAVQVRALLMDRVLSLADEKIDVAIRIGALPDSSLVAIRVGWVRRVVCAAPAYFAVHGIPQRPEALARHRIVMAANVSAVPEWRFAENAEALDVRITPQLIVSTNEAAIAAAKVSWGLTRVMSYQVAAELASGALQTVLSDFETEPLPIHVIFQEGRRASAKVRSFVDFAVARLRIDPAFN